MGLNWDPSKDWDRYEREQEKAMEEKCNFFRAYKTEIAIVVAGILANPSMKPMEKEWSEKDVVEQAVNFVQYIDSWGRPE